ncbi:TPA: receptor [Enterococcus faecium]|uniref:receptor n=1 Tax=Clostridioides difficile TaxID=1496 RepID=UPI000D1DD3A7|nr:receptor [Clostridioides difficile]NTL89651.1 receptor [Enterococcus faecium]MBY1709892.1 receptor [Clostridioides difficile]HBG0433319.1 receptor [Clostridioides difficile]HBH1341900.1 receptor [Clostridioides difficile]HDJ1467141.1 receptor [Clostridioides difficile]
MNIINMTSIIISMVALAICIITAISGILKDGVKGLDKNKKVIAISFVVYAIFFLVFFLTQ